MLDDERRQMRIGHQGGAPASMAELRAALVEFGRIDEARADI